MEYPYLDLPHRTTSNPRHLYTWKGVTYTYFSGDVINVLKGFFYLENKPITEFPAWIEENKDETFSISSLAGPIRENISIAESMEYLSKEIQNAIPKACELANRVSQQMLAVEYNPVIVDGEEKYRGDVFYSSVTGYIKSMAPQHSRMRHTTDLAFSFVCDILEKANIHVHS